MWFLAPSRRVANTAGGGGLDPQLLTLHTIQTRDAYESLRLNGTLTGDPRLGDPHFACAYDWMRQQMVTRVGPGEDGMLWLWSSTTRRQLVRSAKYAPNEVVLTVRVPARRVLLSSFDAWHSVLDQRLEVPSVPGETHRDWSRRSDEMHSAWRKRHGPYSHLPLNQWPPEVRADLEASWVSIFDLSGRRVGMPIQATTREIRASEVTRAVRIC